MMGDIAGTALRASEPAWAKLDLCNGARSERQGNPYRPMMNRLSRREMVRLSAVAVLSPAAWAGEMATSAKPVASSDRSWDAEDLLGQWTGR